MTIDTSIWIRRGLGRIIEHRARLSGKRFYCRALSGESGYNIAINADLSVSCNCQDFDGTGRIGSLRTHTLKEIFDGETATRFREALAEGRLPLATCARCGELRLGTMADTSRRVHSYTLPVKGIMVENTVCCNLRCIGCFRETVMKTRDKRTMSLSDMEIVARTLAEAKTTSVSFFNLGEPFLPANVLDGLRIIRDHNPNIAIHSATNGVLIDSDDKVAAALLLDSLTVSLDGPNQALAERYQVGIAFDRAVANLERLAAARHARGLTRPRLIWKYVLFNWNDKPEMIRRAEALAREIGMDELWIWPTFRPIRGFSFRYYLDPRLRAVGKRNGHLPPNAFARVVLNERGESAT
jgi:sulfatase maturation enzyme AslB (radical SAM superfamily)